MKNEKSNINEKGIRIQKYLSEHGIASRRKSEEWISLGLVYINGEIVEEPGVRFDPQKDKLTLDPAIRQTEKFYYYLYNKPAGIVTVNAQPGEIEILNALKVPKGVVPVGRLDKESSGLIMLTNDGVVARRLMDPSFDHEKEYEVSFSQPFSDEAIQKIEKGMFLFGKKTKPIRIKRINRFMVKMILREGKNRQIRRMCEMAGYRVKKLKRVRVLNFRIDDLPKGRLRLLSKFEISKLFSTIGLDENRTLLHESNKLLRKDRIKKDS
jgi:23S rRNA pseudouridine2605 synthase